MYPPNTRNTRKEIHAVREAKPRIHRRQRRKRRCRPLLRSLSFLLFETSGPSRRTTKLTDRHDLTYENQKLQGKSPGANGGSVQRLVRHSAHSISKISGPLCPKLPWRPAVRPRPEMYPRNTRNTRKESASICVHLR